MSLRSVSFRGISFYVLIALFTVCTYLVLFIFRSSDDNRLTSWKWAFRDADVNMILLFLVCGIGIAYVFSKLSLPERYPPYFLFIFSFVISSVFWREPEVIVDASRYFTQAKHLEVYGISYFMREWGRAIHAWTDLPLVPLLYGIIFKFFGESRVYIQVFTSLVFSLTAVLTYCIGKTLWDETTGFYGGLFLLGIPYLLIQVPLMLVDVPTMFFLTLSVYTFIIVLERGKAYIVFSALSLFLTFRKTVLQRGIVVSYFSGILIGIVMLLKFDVFVEQLRFLHEYQMPGLQRWGESYLSTFFYQTHPFITTAALFSPLIALKKKDIRYLIICWPLILFLVLQIQRARYTLILFPMIALMASYGLQKIRTIEVRKFVVYCSIASSIVIALFAFLPFLLSMSTVNLRNAGEYLHSVRGHTVEVVTLPAENTMVNLAVTVPILDLFTEKEIYYEYDESLLPPLQKIRESSLRFTWTYKNPLYYGSGYKDSKQWGALAVISNGPITALPEGIKQKVKGYRMGEVFRKSSGFFRYTPFVTVYVPGE
jgi:4-amino-4-deoxy-L-arabinose transferase-like glycosyltransferase